MSFNPWDRSVPKRAPKHKDTPFVSEARGLAIADAIDRKRLEEIHAEAEEAAARIMRDWEGRTGR